MQSSSVHRGTALSKCKIALLFVILSCASILVSCFTLKDAIITDGADSAPAGIAYDSSRNLYYVGFSLEPAKIVVLDGSTLERLRSVFFYEQDPSISFIYDLQLDPENAFLYVAVAFPSPSLIRVDVETLQIVQVIQLGSLTGYLSVTPLSTATPFVFVSADHAVLRINMQTSEVVSFALSPSEVVVQPEGTFLDPSGELLYVATSRGMRAVDVESMSSKKYVANKNADDVILSVAYANNQPIADSIIVIVREASPKAQFARKLLLDSFQWDDSAGPLGLTSLLDGHTVVSTSITDPTGHVLYLTTTSGSVIAAPIASWKTEDCVVRHIVMPSEVDERAIWYLRAGNDSSLVGIAGFLFTAAIYIPEDLFTTNTSDYAVSLLKHDFAAPASWSLVSAPSIHTVAFVAQAPNRQSAIVAVDTVSHAVSDVLYVSSESFGDVRTAVFDPVQQLFFFGSSGGLGIARGKIVTVCFHEGKFSMCGSHGLPYHMTDVLVDSAAEFAVSVSIQDAVICKTNLTSMVDSCTSYSYPGAYPDIWRGLAFSANRERAFFINSAEGALVEVDVTHDAPVVVRMSPRLTNAYKWILSSAVSSDDSRIFVFAYSALLVFDRQTLAPIGEYSAFDDYMLQVIVSPDDGSLIMPRFGASGMVDQIDSTQLQPVDVLATEDTYYTVASLCWQEPSNSNSSQIWVLRGSLLPSLALIAL